MSKNKNYNFNTEGQGDESLAETFVSRLRQLSLTQTEAQEMRERLIAYSNMHAALEIVKPIPSPFFSYFNAYSRVLTSGALIILILISGTGISYAAEGTLPGQTLYGVKVGIIEPIQGAFITSTQGQADWQNELTERRLTEASTLAAENKLSASNQAYLATAVSTHVALAQQDANELSDSGNTTAALTVRSSLDASLSAHATLLASVAPRLKAAGDANTSTAVVALLNTVETERTQVDLSRIATEVALGDPSASTDAPVIASATATPAQRTAIAVVNTQNSERVAEESSIIRKNAALFRLLPVASVTSSTSASTTATTTSRIINPWRSRIQSVTVPPASVNSASH